MSVSIGLQYGVPLKALVDKFINTRFEPAGYTGHPAIPYAKSVLDYIARWLGGRFISPDYLTHSGETALPATIVTAAPVMLPAANATADFDPPSASAGARPMFDGAPTCSECGMLMTPNGACYKCENCGGTSGCELSKSRRKNSTRGHGSPCPLFLRAQIHHQSPRYPAVARLFRGGVYLGQGLPTEAKSSGSKDPGYSKSGNAAWMVL